MELMAQFRYHRRTDLEGPTALGIYRQVQVAVAGALLDIPKPFPLVG